MDKKKRIIAISTLSALLAFTLYYVHEYEYTPRYSLYAEDSLPYGKYSKGDVYIGDEEYIESIKDNINEDDILIIMGYQDGEPNATILSSYEITSKGERDEILRILKHYEIENPSEWNRSLESMRLEWTVHNILYNLGYKRDRTKDCDLDNPEEKIYSNKILQRLIK